MRLNEFSVDPFTFEFFDFQLIVAMQIVFGPAMIPNENAKRYVRDFLPRFF